MNTKYIVALAAVLAALFMNSASVYASKTDDKIESSAKKSYVFKNYLKNDDIKVESRDGVVTLTGTVSEESHKSLAQDTVADLPGVKSVNNKLEVKGEQPSEMSDAWVVAKVKLALLFHKSTSAGKTEVDAKNGVVTLRGHAASEAQKELTTEYVKDIKGVKDVKNDMTVPKTSTKIHKMLGEKVDDASITAQVKMALLFHHSTSAIGTKVKTKHGVVTVSGKAENNAEKDLVTKLVSDIKGVKDVDNKMTVEKSE